MGPCTWHELFYMTLGTLNLECYGRIVTLERIFFLKAFRVEGLGFSAPRLFFKGSRFLGVGFRQRDSNVGFAAARASMEGLGRDSFSEGFGSWGSARAHCTMTGGDLCFRFGVGVRAGETCERLHYRATQHEHVLLLHAHAP